MDSLYDNLLEYYDEIFPVDEERIGFVLREAAERGSLSSAAGVRVKLLDVGCATGAFALSLMKRGLDVTGIDLNAAMIQSACRRNPEPRTNARFFRMDMLEIGKTFAPEHFDVVLCLGNTLVHLDGPDSILRFLKQAWSVCRAKGAFICQVVNYERVLREGLTRLPTIETSRARFERDYRERTDGRISFETTLFSSSGQAVFRDKTALYPATPMELRDLMKDAGFGEVALYDDFSGRKLSGEELGVVLVAER